MDNDELEGLLIDLVADSSAGLDEMLAEVRQFGHGMACSLDDIEAAVTRLLDRDMLFAVVEATLRPPHEPDREILVEVPVYRDARPLRELRFQATPKALASLG